MQRRSNGWRPVRWAVLAVLTLLLASCGQQATVNEEGTLAPAASHVIDVITSGASASHNGAVFEQVPAGDVSGTGVFDPFLRVQAQGNADVQNGFNTDVQQPSYASGTPGYDARDPKTIARLLSTIPSIDHEGVRYREVFLDLNEAGNSNLISIDDLRVYVVDSDVNDELDLGDDQFDAPAGMQQQLAWRLNEPGDPAVVIGLADLSTGSGRPDYRILIPEAAFEEFADSCSYGALGCELYFVMHVTMGGEDGYGATSTFEEFNTKIRPALHVEKTADVAFTRTFPWTVAKAVDPDEHHLFDGDDGDSAYEVTATKGEPVDSDFVISGEITILNTTTVDGSIVSVDDVYQTAGGDEAVDVDCGVDLPYLIEAGETLVCTYEHASDAGGTNEATVVLVDPEDDQPSSYVATADATAGEPTTVVNDTVDVTDLFDGDETVLGTEVAETTTFDAYDRTFDCSDVTFDEGALVSSTASYLNTATVTGDDGVLDQDTATVEVTCYRPGVSKDAETSFTRTYEWDVDKVAVDEFGDPITEPIVVGVGGSVDLHYDIVVTLVGSSDSGWAVAGDISVTNPHPSDALTVALSDVVSPDIEATLDCGGELTVEPGETETCGYAADLPDGADRTNTATATAFGADYTAEADVTFGDPTDEVDTAVDVYDDFEGGGDEFLGTVGLSDLVGGEYTIDVVRTAGADGDVDVLLACGDNVIDNTATLETNDTATQADDSASVVVTLICECADETAWGDGPRYEGAADWATYTPYDGTETTVDLYAGQTLLAGEVHLSAPDAEDMVTVTVTLFAPWEFADDGDNVKIEVYDDPPAGNPSPGQFTHKFDAEASPFSVEVPLGDFYGVHVDVIDCSF